MPSKLTVKQQRTANTIKRRNREFNALTKAEKRVRIAKDVIAQITAKKIKPYSGRYLDMQGVDTFVEPEQDLQATFKGMPSCTACALGSVFVCAVQRADKLKAMDVVGCEAEDFTEDEKVDLNSLEYNDDFMRTYLKPFFSEDQLRLIENAFEQDTILNVEDNETNEDAIDFRTQLALDIYNEKHKTFVDDTLDLPCGEDSVTDEIALLGIMENIIINNGTFKP